LLVELVDHLTRVTHSLFKAMPSFTMSTKKDFKKYREEEAAVAKGDNTEERKALERECMWGWLSLIGRRGAMVTLNGEILTPKLLELIDDCNTAFFENVADYFQTLDPQWTGAMTGYAAAITELLDANVVSQVYEKRADDGVAQELMPKLLWILHDHTGQSRIPLYPLLTKATIHMIASALKSIQRAAEEVRYLH